MLNINSFNLNHVDRHLKNKKKSEKLKFVSEKVRDKVLEMLALFPELSANDMSRKSGLHQTYIASVANALNDEGILDRYERKSPKGWPENVFSLA